MPNKWIFRAYMQINHSQTKNHSAESEKSFGAEWGKAVWEKAQKRPQNRKRSPENDPQRARTDVSAYIWQLSKSSRKRHRALPERHAMRPTRPSFRQKGSLSPHSLTNRKPQNRWESFIFLHAPTRPQMNDYQRGETYFLTFCRFPPLMVPPLIHWKCTARPVWHPQRIPGFHGKTNCCKTR